MTYFQRHFSGTVTILLEHLRIMATNSLSFSDHFVLYDVSWEAYSKFMDALGERRLRHTYQEGTLEMMSPSEKHEEIKSFLGRMIEMASLECGHSNSIRWVRHATKQEAVASVGARRIVLHRTAARWHGKRKTETKKPLCPDLVVEVDLRRTVLERLDSYAKLGVREVWRYRKGELEFLVLEKSRGYELVECSTAFPAISSKDVSDF